MLDETATVVSRHSGRDRLRLLGLERPGPQDRFLHFGWLPGAIATEFVSTDGRSFRQPPDEWKFGTGATASPPGLPALPRP